MGKPSRKKRKGSGEIAVEKANAQTLHNSSCLPSKGPLPGGVRLNYFFAGLVSLITFAVYLSSLGNDFVNWDDGVYVGLNPHIRSLNAIFLKWAFLDFYAGNWHPLTWISHALDYAIWGLNPLGHHLTNNIIHAITTFIVVVLAARLVGVWKGDAVRNGLSGFPDSKTALVTGVVAGFLFGLHPIHVESVAWVSERKDLLCATFFLLSISSYTKYISDKYTKQGQSTASFFSNRHYLSAVGFFVLALLSKPMAVTLPLVLIILDWFPFRRLRLPEIVRVAVIEKLPFLVLSLVSSILTVLAQRSSGAIGNAPLSARILVAFNSLAAYLWKIILPFNLLPFYPFPRRESFLYSNYLPAVALVAGISVLSLVFAKKKKIWLAAWCYYLATLLPVLGIVQVGLQSMADRYSYLPSLGPFLVMGSGAAWISEKVDALTHKGRAIKIITIAAMLVLVSLSYLTVKQIGIWKNGFALWNYEIEKEPEKVPLAYINRGIIFFQKGKPDKAISDFDKAITLDPSYDEAYNQRALVYEKEGQLDKAIADLQKVLTLNTSDIETRIRLGILYGKTGSFDKAIDKFNEAVGLNPRYPLPYDNRGFAYFLSGQYDRALRDFNKAIELNQTYTNAYINRGNLYVRTGKNMLAMADFRKACDLKNERGCSALRSLQKAAGQGESRNNFIP